MYGSVDLSRQPLSKKVRFDVFKRDLFTCQYCGSRPPDVVLEIDHIHPIVEGGTNDTTNLLTACVECNRGKGRVRLDVAEVRPDADLLWLAAQQETAELRRYGEALDERQVELQGTVDSLQGLFSALTDFDWMPSDNLLFRMLDRCGPEATEAAIRVTASGLCGGWVQKSYFDRYMWGVAWGEKKAADA